MRSTRIMVVGGLVAALVLATVPGPAGAGIFAELKVRRHGGQYKGAGVIEPVCFVGEHTATEKVDVGEQGRFDVALKNYGGAAGTATLTLPGIVTQVSLKVKFVGPNGNNITSAVFTGGKTFHLEPGQQKKVRVKLTPTDGTSGQYSQYCFGLGPDRVTTRVQIP